jgi:transcriptional regulator with XRE-family HTH domain
MPKPVQYKKFAEWFKETREASAMSQAQFARRIGKSQGFVARTETGERRMDIVEFIELAIALGTSPPKLFQRVCDLIK